MQTPELDHRADARQAEAISDGTRTANPEDDSRPTHGPRPSADEIDAVLQAAQLLVAMSARSLAAVETEVSLPQLRVLVILASEGPQSLNALARSLNIHPSNATRACDKLVAARLIHRGEASHDRRALALELTAAGLELIDKVMRHRRDQVEQFLSRVPASERQALASAFRTFAAAGTNALDQDAWQAGWTTASGPGLDRS